MVRRNRLGILQRPNDAAVDARDRNNHCVLNWTKLVKSFRGELFRDDHIVVVNGTKHEHKQRNNYDHYPSPMYELGGNEDTENDGGSDGPYRINYNGFLPV